MNVYLNMLFVMLLGIPAMLLHECGHIVVALLCGVKVKRVGLCKTGLYTVREPGPNWANLCISLAGPLTNLVLAVSLREAMPTFAWVNAIAFGYNLLPIPNSDGSRVLALLSSGTTLRGAAKPSPATMGRQPAS